MDGWLQLEVIGDSCCLVGAAAGKRTFLHDVRAPRGDGFSLGDAIDETCPIALAQFG
jgi:hypothetical protein